MRCRIGPMPGLKDWPAERSAMAPLRCRFLFVALALMVARFERSKRPQAAQQGFVGPPLGHAKCARRAASRGRQRNYQIAA